jgi:hypothetical protein
MTIQMFTNPRLTGRVDDLNAFAEAAKSRVAATLAGLGVTAKDLSAQNWSKTRIITAATGRREPKRRNRPF